MCAACLRATDVQSQRQLPSSTPPPHPSPHHPSPRPSPSLSPSASPAAAAGVCSVHSCAHITLGYTTSSEGASQAGDDLLRVRRLEACQSLVARPISVDDATLYHYGDALCSVRFARTLHLTALFSPIY